LPGQLTFLLSVYNEKYRIKHKQNIISAIRLLSLLMTSQYFTYNKPKVIQALRYHFITRREIKIMMILVNIFAIIAAALFFFKKVSPFSFLVSSVLWFVLMIVFWFLLPQLIYKKFPAFKD
jgi:hypothetical protein